MQITDPGLPSVKKIQPVSTKQHEPLTPPKEGPDLKKRKRDDLDEADPKLQEFLEVMNPGHAPKRPREQDAVSAEVEMAPPPDDDGESDGEYEEIPARSSSKNDPKTARVVATDDVSLSQPQMEAATPNPEVARDAPLVGATDDEWLRSRTNRLLDLVDPDDQSFAARTAPGTDAPSHIPTSTGPKEEQPVSDAAVGQPDESAEPGDGDDAESLIHKTARLFVRNLPYAATEDNLRARFEKFGAIQEVCNDFYFFFCAACPYDESQIGTAYTQSRYMMQIRAQYFSRCFEFLKIGRRIIGSCIHAAA